MDYPFCNSCIEEQRIFEARNYQRKKQETIKENMSKTQ